jgi:hypothetical protein
MKNTAVERCDIAAALNAACLAAGASSTMDKEARFWRQRLLVGGAFALPVAVVSMGSMLPGLESWGRGPLVLGAMPLMWVVQAVFAAVVQVGFLAPAKFCLLLLTHLVLMAQNACQCRLCPCLLDARYRPALDACSCWLCCSKSECWDPCCHT